MSYSLIIADENKSSRDLIKFKIETAFDSQLSIVASCSNPAETIGSIFIHQPRIVLVDIKMFDNHHLDVVERLLSSGTQKLEMVIIATENQLPMIRRIVEIGIAGLLIKPVSAEDLKKTLTRVVSRVEEAGLKDRPVGQFITLRSNRSRLMINQDDIVYIESSRNICSLTLKDGMVKTINENISSIEQRLSLKQLVRIDKSTILHLGRIVFLDSDIYNKSCRLRLMSGDEITKSLTHTGVERLHKLTQKS